MFADVATAEEEPCEAATATNTDDNTAMNEDDGPIMLTSRTKRVSDNDTILLNEEAFYYEIDGKTPRGESLKKKKR